MEKICIHKCEWKKTGCERYTFPGQYELECTACGKKKWREYKQSIPQITLTEKQMEERIKAWNSKAQ